MDRFLEFFENREANYLSQNSDNYSMKRHSEYRICFYDRSLFETDPRQLAGETIGTDRVRFLKGW